MFRKRGKGKNWPSPMLIQMCMIKSLFIEAKNEEEMKTQWKPYHKYITNYLFSVEMRVIRGDDSKNTVANDKNFNWYDA